MPTYEYLCKKCGHKQEALQKMSDAPLKVCEACNEESLQRGFGGGIGLSFKGQGFYITDYAANKPSPTPSSPECCPCGKEKNNCSSSKSSE